MLIKNSVRKLCGGSLFLLMLMFSLSTAADDSTAILATESEPTGMLLEQGLHTFDPKDPTTSQVITQKSCAPNRKSTLSTRVVKSGPPTPGPFNLPLPIRGFVNGLTITPHSPVGYTIKGNAYAVPDGSLTVFWQIWCK